MATEEGRRAYEDILSVIAGLDDKEEIRKLFDDLFTDAEVADFVLRWLLMDDLKRGRSQRDIARNRNISLCKITRGSKMLKKKDGFMRALLSERYDDHLHL
ncbi:MAG TPA: transcriptional regulator [Candidatus Ornithospirochaeta stercorigallinarum]|nr:transcriptional regulator [Candidatus Ornithospirochaeta stercorigallinarum]